MNCIREAVGWNAWRSLNLFIEYDHSIADLPYDVPVQPVASAHRLQYLSMYSRYCSLMRNMPW
jgi:hypothetical protein